MIRLVDHARVTCESLAYSISACKSACEYSAECLQGDFARLELDGETDTRGWWDVEEEDCGSRVADALARLPSVFVSTYPAAYCYHSPLFVGICKSTRCVNSRTPDAVHRCNVSACPCRDTHSRAVLPMLALIAADLFHFSCLSFFPPSTRRVLDDQMDAVRKLESKCNKMVVRFTPLLLALLARNSRVRVFELYEINSRLLFDTIGRESTPGRARLSKASSRAWRSISYDKDLLSHGFSFFRFLFYPDDPSSRRRSLQRRRRFRPPYLYLSIFFSLHSRHAYVCTEYKGIKRGKRLYQELLRCSARDGRNGNAGRRFSISHLGGPDYRPSGYR